ncbi:hypothetical protein WBP06_18460 (plasmid) [Novosphingobium sp. BL-8H]|uniref:hypothetical protein n=1 Tax=Novosphingobium sp. BL-8H TaxID=3127640 RepID=UPI00375844F7
MPDQDADRLLSEVSLKWAFDAYDKFAARLSPEVRRHMGAQRKETYTVVFGRTQVGKSTLILHLLRVRADAIDLVSNVLRGGRKSGNSSTALPTEYRQARDDCWRISWGGQSWLCVSDGDARENFEKVRAAMEANVACADGSLCRVDIPARYFETAASDVRGTRVLDLPGMDAANGAERRFVARVAERLVPNADLVLLVGRADDLTFLLPDQLALPGVSDWQITPRRFRVVTTYSFTPASVREFGREHDCVGDVGKYRERLIGEIQKFRPLEPPAQTPELYFPLEFGESWKGACDLHSSEMTEMMDGLMQRLREDIAAASTPIGRLEGALDAHVLVTAVHSRRLEEIRERLDKKQQAVRARERAIGQLEKALEEQRDSLSFQRANLEALTERAINKGAMDAGNGLHKIVMEWWWSQMEQQALQVKGPDRNTDFLLSMLGEAEDNLRRQIAKAAHTAEPPDGLSMTSWRQAQESAGRLAIANVAKAADSAFSEVRSTLGGYWTKYYVRNRSYEEDFAKLTAAYIQFIGNIAAHITKNIKAEIEAARRTMQDDVGRLEMKKIYTSQRRESDSIMLGRLQVQLQDCQTERDEAERTIREEAALSRQFTQLLADEYERAVETAYAEVMKAADPATAFEHLVMASMLRESRESVWTRINGAKKQ